MLKELLESKSDLPTREQVIAATDRYAAKWLKGVTAQHVDDKHLIGTELYVAGKKFICKRSEFHEGPHWGTFVIYFYRPDPTTHKMRVDSERMELKLFYDQEHKKFIPISAEAWVRDAAMERGIEHGEIHDVTYTLHPIHTRLNLHMDPKQGEVKDDELVQHIKLLINKSKDEDEHGWHSASEEPDFTHQIESSLAHLKSPKRAKEALKPPLMTFTLNWLKSLADMDDYSAAHGSRLRDWVKHLRSKGLDYPELDHVMHSLRGSATKHLEEARERYLEGEIVDIFKDELAKMSKNHDLTAKENGSWIQMRYIDLAAQDASQSISFRVKDGQFDLADVYVPFSLRNKGYLTNSLTRVRKLKGINGKCHVFVGVNQKGWRTILERAGFEMV